MQDDTSHLAVNQRHWDDQAHEWVATGELAWAASEPTWGIWGVDDSTVGLLPADIDGLHAIELGCGTGYVSAWMARRGATVTGIDLSERQLATARRLATEHDVDITLLHGNAEEVPAPDGSFDFAISEYGAALWCDPERWVPEAHRLLRPGGRLAMLTNHPLTVACSPRDGSLPLTRRLEQPYFTIDRQDWSDAVDDPGGIEFNRTIGGWFELFRRVGFTVDDLVEVRAPAPGAEQRFYATADWAHDFPTEIVFKLHK